jgi:hypothetical protein
MSDQRIIPSRFSNVCPLCAQRWQQGAPISPFSDQGEYVGRWGHPACVAADEMGLPSAEGARERIAAIRAEHGWKPKQ